MCNLKESCSCLRKISKEVHGLSDKIQQNIKVGKHLTTGAKLYRIGMIHGLDKIKEVIDSAHSKKGEAIMTVALK
jgi:hypothetical protein